MWMAQAPGMNFPPKIPGIPWTTELPPEEEWEAEFAEFEIGAALAREEEEWVQ